MFKKLSHIIIRHEFHRDYLLNKSLETIYILYKANNFSFFNTIHKTFFGKRKFLCFFPISCQTRRRLSDDLESRVNALWVVSRQSSNLVRTHTRSKVNDVSNTNVEREKR